MTLQQISFPVIFDKHDKIVTKQLLSILTMPSIQSHQKCHRPITGPAKKNLEKVLLNSVLFILKRAVREVLKPNV